MMLVSVGGKRNSSKADEPPWDEAACLGTCSNCIFSPTELNLLNEGYLSKNVPPTATSLDPLLMPGCSDGPLPLFGWRGTAQSVHQTPLAFGQRILRSALGRRLDLLTGEGVGHQAHTVFHQFALAKFEGLLGQRLGTSQHSATDRLGQRHDGPPQTLGHGSHPATALHRRHGCAAKNGNTASPVHGR